MKCPRCQAVLSGGTEAGVVVCSSCGARLRTRPGSPPAQPNSPPPPAAPAGAPASDATALDRLLSEVQAVRRVQEEILALLQAGGGHAATGAPGAFDPDDDDGPLSLSPRGAAAASPPAIRSGRRKAVLLIDDDEASRNAVVAALNKAEVPLRAVSDGGAAIAAIAEEKPDVIVLELDLGGSTAGKDVVNMIKATMEWVDIPIVLHTRAAIESQKEARQIHGADELVPKSPTSPEALVARVIALFRKA